MLRFSMRRTLRKLMAEKPRCAYDFVVKDKKGADYPLAQHTGKCLLIANVASQ